MSPRETSRENVFLKALIKKVLETGNEYTVRIVHTIRFRLKVYDGMFEMYRIATSYYISNEPNILRKITLILKSPIKGKDGEEIVDFIQTEIMIYNEIAPRLSFIFGKDHSINGVDNCLLAESYFTMEENLVVLEDLEFKGYRRVNSLKQLLDYEHCIIALKTLAKYHAGTVILHEQEPGLVELIGKEPFFHNDWRNKYAVPTMENYKTIGNEYKKIPEIQKYAKWFEENSDQMWLFLVGALKQNRDDFNVLNHGLYWIMSLLFKYDENNKPKKTVPVDFNTCRFTSPAIDFLHFMYSSVLDDVRTENYEHFICAYVNELNINLEKFGSEKRLKVNDFKKSLRDRAYLALSVSVNLLPLALSSPNGTEINLTRGYCKAIKEQPYLLNRFLCNERNVRILSKRLEEFEKLGVISTI